MTRVGIAGIEILRDSYFYKQIDGDALNIISFFRTARPLANIAAATISAVLLLFFPLWTIFIVVSFALLFSLVEACFLRDTKNRVPG